MSFVSLNASDFVVSADSITSTLWSGNNPILNQFFTSSTTSSFNFFLDVFQTSSLRSDAEVQQITEEKQAAQQQQMEMMNAMQQSQVAKNVAPAIETLNETEQQQ